MKQIVIMERLERKSDITYVDEVNEQIHEKF